MQPRSFISAMVLMALIGTLTVGQVEFRTFDGDGEWTMVEYSMGGGYAGPLGPTTGPCEGRTYESEGVIGTVMPLTWKVNGSNVEIWNAAGTTLIMTLNNGAIHETGAVSGSSNTWVNIDFE